MPESDQLTNGAAAEQPTETQHIERSDTGVSITVQLKRGQGTRDEDKIKGKVKAKTLDEAQDNMEVLQEYLHKLAGDARQIQPEVESE